MGKSQRIDEEIMLNSKRNGIFIITEERSPQRWALKTSVHPGSQFIRADGHPDRWTSRQKDRNSLLLKDCYIFGLGAMASLGLVCLFCLLLYFFETRCHHVNQADFEFTVIHLPLSSRCGG